MSLVDQERRTKSIEENARSRRARWSRKKDKMVRKRESSR